MQLKGRCTDFFITTQLIILSFAAFSFCKVIDIDELLNLQQLSKASIAEREMAIQQNVNNLRSGDVLLLSRNQNNGMIDLTNIPDNVTIRWGEQGILFLGGTHSGLTILDTRCPIIAMSKSDYLAKRTRPTKKAFLQNSFISNAPFISNMEMDNVRMIGLYGNDSNLVKLDHYGGLTVSGRWTNCSLLYLWFEAHAKGVVSFTDVDASNSKIYGISETDYCNKVPSVIFTNTKGLTYGNGDTERANSPAGVYNFINCQDMTLVCHRNFHSHSGCATTEGKGYVVMGGKNNTFLMVQDIGDNGQYSFELQATENFKAFGLFLEDNALIGNENVNPFFMFYTPAGFGNAPAKAWISPAIVNQEKIFSYQGVIIDTATTVAPREQIANISIPRPPLVPELTLKPGYGASKRAIQNLTTQSWGKGTLAMGVDNTGKKSSHTTLQRLINSKNFIELPEGTILLDKPLIIPPRFDIKKLTIAGPADHKTKFITTGNFPTFVQEDAALQLKKNGKSMQDLAVFELHGTVFDGQGVQGCGFYRTGIVGRTIFDGNTYQNFIHAGVIIGDSSEIDNIKFILKKDGYDQVQWRNCRFINSGKYGLYCNREQVDKQLYYNCTFEGQKKAGLSIQRSHMIESSSIVNCTFKNIDGPSVIWGGNTIPGNGNAPVMNMMMNCLVEECGNSKSAAIEYSFTNQSLIVNNKIIIKTKPWLYGYAGTAAVVQRNIVDVDVSKMVSGGAAFAFRHPRRVANNRLTGNYISDNTSNGKMIFIDDISSFEEKFGEILSMPNGRCEYPYAFTHIISNCSFDNGQQTYDYVMIKTNKTAEIQEIIPMGKGVRTDYSLSKPKSLLFKMDESKNQLYTISGRRIAKSEHGSLIKNSTLTKAKGMYLIKKANGKIATQCSF